jgi:hypothetical protein
MSGRGRGHWWKVDRPAAGRYWVVPAKVPEDICVSQAGTSRPEHSLDKDGRCIFCDWVNPESEA